MLSPDLWELAAESSRGTI